MLPFSPAVQRRLPGREEDMLDCPSALGAAQQGLARDERHVLIVDDEKRIIEVFSRHLEELGYVVGTASNREDALMLIQGHKFDIAFLDYFLGASTGFDLMAAMAELDPELYFVIMTAGGNTDLAVEALKRGASDFISKPFFVADLVKSIDFIEKRRELDRQKKQMLMTLELRLTEKTEELQKVYFAVLSSLAQAMEKKDMGTYGHSMRVRRYAGIIASGIGLNAGDKENLKVAAMLHDLGKIGTSDFILGKAGPLDPSELADVRNHPQRGVDILKPLTRNFRQFESILPAILYHHESFDGTGYPAGLAGDDIPLLARIISTADTYDAILSDRPYRSAATHAKAMEELLSCAGSQFDPTVVNAFADAYERHGKWFESVASMPQG
jgi:putative two-component system response regulator